ncbi:MAG: hypothetical protein NVSMB46_09900 [Candidatus Saccharimonadales bacterium]
MSATTDSDDKVVYDLINKPGISNLLQIHSLLTNIPIQELERIYSGTSQYGALKKDVADNVKIFLNEFQKNVMSVSHTDVLDKLYDNEKSINETANDTLYKVQKAIGLRN